MTATGKGFPYSVQVFDRALGIVSVLPQIKRLLWRGPSIEAANQLSTESSAWGGANADFNSSSFGLITSKSGSRQVQLAVKYIF